MQNVGNHFTNTIDIRLYSAATQNQHVWMDVREGFLTS